MKKGQYFSFDAIIASVIFMMALVLLLSYWHSTKVLLDYQASDVVKECIRISSLLFVPPYPENVPCSSIQNLGFAVSWDDRRLNGDLLGCADRMSSGDLKKKFSTPYNVSIKVTYPDDNSWFVIGENIPSDTSKLEEVVNMRRAATVYNKTDGSTRLAIIDISVYREKIQR